MCFLDCVDAKGEAALTNNEFRSAVNYRLINKRILAAAVQHLEALFVKQKAAAQEEVVDGNKYVSDIAECDRNHHFPLRYVSFEL